MLIVKMWIVNIVKRRQGMLLKVWHRGSIDTPAMKIVAICGPRGTDVCKTPKHCEKTKKVALQALSDNTSVVL